MALTKISLSESLNHDLWRARGVLDAAGNQEAVWGPVPDATAAAVAIVQARAILDAAEMRAVRLLREEGVSWAAVGQALGITAQAVHKRYA